VISPNHVIARNLKLGMLVDYDTALTAVLFGVGGLRGKMGALKI